MIMKIQSHSIGLAVCLALTATTAVVSLTGCAGDRNSRSTGQYIDDKTLQARVHHALNEDPIYKFENVTVTVYRGTVQLGGFVIRNDQQSRAGQIAQNVEGVGRVVNDVIVRQGDGMAWDNDRRNYNEGQRPDDFTPTGRSPNDHPYTGRGNNDQYNNGQANDNNRTTGEYVDDKALTSRVKNAIDRNGEMKLDDVKVNIQNGTVQLNGFVNTPEQKNRAAELARQVPGVREVVNNITVK
jgi:hyperosmotically inducible protein